MGLAATASILITMAAVPLGPIDAWILPDDYPAAALRAESEGRVDAELTLSQDGSPVSCSVKQGTSDAALNQATCSLLMARARFQPSDSALAPFRLVVAWRIPGNAPVTDAFVSGSIAKFNISSSGKLVGCHEHLIGNGLLGFSGTCETFEGGSVNALEALLGESIAGATRGSMMMTISKSASRDVDVTIVPSNARFVRLADASFTIGPGNRITSCVSLEKSPILGDVCRAIRAAISPQDRFPLHGKPFRFTVELAAN